MNLFTCVRCATKALDLCLCPKEARARAKARPKARSQARAKERALAVSIIAKFWSFNLILYYPVVQHIWAFQPWSYIPMYLVLVYSYASFLMFSIILMDPFKIFANA